MTIHVLHAGDGYTYLTRSVAAHDETLPASTSLADYYTAKGNPPGRWTGRAAASLGVDGTVAEEQMRALFGEGRHPDADRIEADAQAAGESADEALGASRLGRRFPQYKRRNDIRPTIAAAYAAAKESAGRPLTPDERADVRRQVVLDAFQEVRGRQPADEQELRKFEAGVLRGERDAVAGYDFVFSPVKSVSVLWGIGSDHVREQIHQAHSAAVASVVDWLERSAAFTRTGSEGQAQLDTEGIIAARFDHFDSRAGDPDLHTHVAVSNKVQGPDGKWRSLDGRALFAAAVSMSERYNTTLEDELRRRVGVQFAPRAEGRLDHRRPVREIVGVPPDLLSQFSKRRHGIEQHYADLLADYRAAYARDPDEITRKRLYQQATLTERPDKEEGRPLVDLIAQWRAEADRIAGPGTTDRVEAAALGQQPAREELVGVAELARVCLERLEASRSTWTVHNLRAEVYRQTRPLPVDDRERLVDEVTDAALGGALRIEVPRLIEEPDQLQRRDGESVFVPHASARYTTSTMLDAEARIVAAARRHSDWQVSREIVEDLIRDREAEGVRFNVGQTNLARQFVTDPTQVMLALAPAGTGKTTAMKTVTGAWRAAGRRVVALAPSSAAADVLGDELGVEADTLAKFDHEQAPIEPGTMILVDEAGLAGTLLLDRTIARAAEAGAVVRLVGDDQQLAAIEAGGVLRTLAHDVGALRLAEVMRFQDPVEAAATVGIREGAVEALEFYQERRRITEGETSEIVDRAYDAFTADLKAGGHTLLIAATGDQVTELNSRARADRVAGGQVATDGLNLRDGTVAAVGDHIATRTNARHLAVLGGKDWVKNGDAWLVVETHEDGALTAVHRHHGGRVTLPADYVAAHVQLDYARTVHRAQGLTVDRAHLIVDPSLTRETLYVGLSRARQGTQLYVSTMTDLGPGHRPEHHGTGLDVLAGVLQRSGVEPSATDAIRDAQAAAENLRQMASEYDYAVGVTVAERYSAIAEGVHAGLTDDPAWPTLASRVRQAEADGWNPQSLLTRAAGMREFSTAESDCQVMVWRIDKILTTQAAPTRPEPGGEVPRWLGLPPPAGAPMHDYLDQRYDQIRGRVDELGRAAAEAPWAQHLAGSPEATRTALRQVAAYRDVFAVTSDDPLGDRPRTAGRQQAAWDEANRALRAAAPDQQASRQGPAELLERVRGLRDQDDSPRRDDPPTTRSDRGPTRGR